MREFKDSLTERRAATTTRTSSTACLALRPLRAAGSLSRVRIARELLDEMVAHARADAPNECCGMIAARDGEAVRVYRAENVAREPGALRDRRRATAAVVNEIEDEGWELGAIYHSHTRSEPYPSQTDINFAAQLARLALLIVGVAGERARRARLRHPRRRRSTRSHSSSG